MNTKKLTERTVHVRQPPTVSREEGQLKKHTHTQLYTTTNIHAHSLSQPRSSTSSYLQRASTRGLRPKMKLRTGTQSCNGRGVNTTERFVKDPHKIGQKGKNSTSTGVEKEPENTSIVSINNTSYIYTSTAADHTCSRYMHAPVAARLAASAAASLTSEPLPASQPPLISAALLARGFTVDVASFCVMVV